MTRFGGIGEMRLFRWSLAISSMIIFAYAGPSLAQSFTFSNPSPINIQAVGRASPYPSEITVPSFCCGKTVSKLTVTLSGFTHIFPADVGVLLVAPGGQKIRLMTDEGSNDPVFNANLTFDDEAAAQLSNAPIVSGTFKPSFRTFINEGNSHPINFLDPAPPAPYSLLLSDVIGTDPAGNWQLFVDDDTSSNSGEISAGWSITLTMGTVFTNSDSILIPGIVTGQASLYPSTINVAGVTQTVTKVKVKLNNFVHDQWDDVGILLVGPHGQAVRLTSDNGGNANALGDYVFDDNAANSIPDGRTPPAVPGTYAPSIDGGNDNGSAAMPLNFPLSAPSAPYAASLSTFNGIDPNGNWSLFFFDDTDNNSSGFLTDGWELVLETVQTTAAAISIEGRVTQANGLGISRATVTLRSAGESMSTTTNLFGHYSFSGITPGRTYVLSVAAKRYQFSQTSRVVSPTVDLADLDFIALPE